MLKVWVIHFDLRDFSKSFSNVGKRLPKFIDYDPSYSRASVVSVSWALTSWRSGSGGGTRSCCLCYACSSSFSWSAGFPLWQRNKRQVYCLHGQWLPTVAEKQKVGLLSSSWSAGFPLLQRNKRQVHCLPHGQLASYCCKETKGRLRGKGPAIKRRTFLRLTL